MSSAIVLRPLDEKDATAFEEAFAEMGWNKPAAQFLRYLQEQEDGRRAVVVAEWQGTIAGYVTVLWESDDPMFTSCGVPEIKDFNVLSRCRRHGIGTALMDAAEAMVAERSPVVGLGVGLHPGYGNAQRLYVLRGYVPDGAGVVVDGTPAPEGSEIRLDDSPMLRMTKKLRILTASVAALVLLGCEPPGTNADSAFAQRDSAGVTIAEAPGPIWEATAQWTVSAEPVVEIGAVDGSAEYLFGRIRGVVRLPDGRIVVADAGSNSLRWYDPSGTFLFQRGGPGEGPGEFSRLGGIALAPGDTLVVTDSGSRRITLFSSQGELAGTLPIEGLAVPGTAYRLLDGGFVLGSTGFSTTQLTGEESGMHRAIEPLLRIGHGAAADTVGMFPGPEMYVHARGIGFHPFSRGFHYGVHGELVYVASGEEFVIDAYSADGQIVRSIRAPDVDLRLTPEMIERFKQNSLEAAAEQNEEIQAESRRTLEEMYFPDTRPAYSRLLVSDDALWLAEHGASQTQRRNRWAIFGLDGEFRGTVVLPEDFGLLGVQGDLVLGSWRDELDVEYVRVYRVVPAGSVG